MPLPIRILRIALGLVFLGAGITKLLPPNHRLLFEMAVSAHRVLSPDAVVWAGWLIPLFEIALGALLLAGWRTRLVAPIAALVLFLFLGFMTSAYMRGIQSYCGCFGFGEPISEWTLARDAAFLLAALVVAVAAWRGRRRPAAAPVGTALGGPGRPPGEPA